MADPNILNDILANWPIFLIVIILIVIIIFIISRRKNDTLEYKPQPLKKTVGDDLGDKLDFMGRHVKGKIYIGFQRIAITRKFARVRGTFAISEFDAKTRNIKIKKDGEPIPYDLFIIECLSNNFIIRWFTLGLLGRFKMIIKNDGAIRVNEQGDIMMPEGMDMALYGKVWANSMESLEYITNISMKRLMEQIQMHEENIPDKFVALEMNQAKNERTFAKKMDKKKDMYKDKEDAGESDREA